MHKKARLVIALSEEFRGMTWREEVLVKHLQLTFPGTRARKLEGRFLVRYPEAFTPAVVEQLHHAVLTYGFEVVSEPINAND